jgi:hypothetical protein
MVPVAPQTRVQPTFSADLESAVQRLLTASTNSEDDNPEASLLILGALPREITRYIAEKILQAIANADAAKQQLPETTLFSFEEFHLLTAIKHEELRTRNFLKLTLARLELDFPIFGFEIIQEENQIIISQTEPQNRKPLGMPTPRPTHPPKVYKHRTLLTNPPRTLDQLRQAIIDLCKPLVYRKGTEERVSFEKFEPVIARFKSLGHQYRQQDNEEMAAYVRLAVELMGRLAPSRNATVVLMKDIRNIAGTLHPHLFDLIA